MIGSFEKHLILIFKKKKRKYMRGQSGIKGRDGVPIVRSGIMLLNALYQFDNYDS